MKIDINDEQCIVFDISKYISGNLAITAKTEDGERLTDITMDTDVIFPPDEAVVDVVNWPNIENIIKIHQLGKPTGEHVCLEETDSAAELSKSPNIPTYYPIYQFDISKIRNYKKASGEN